MTSSIIAVFQRLELSLLERLLASATGESSIELVSFRNQAPGAGGSVPDARMTARFDFWFETKTDRGAVNQSQLLKHLEALDKEDPSARLIVITPDSELPPVIGALGDKRIWWFSFADLVDAMNDAMQDRNNFVGEQARFLLQELIAMFDEDGLLAADDTVVVAAKVRLP